MDFIIQRDDSEALQHYGILGMKWGVRRYQNKDGTWTEKGKKRYNSADGDNKGKDSVKRQTKNKQSSDESAEAVNNQDAQRERAEAYMRIFYAMKIRELLRNERALEKQEREIDRRIRSAKYGTATGRTSADDVRAARKAKYDWEKGKRENERKIRYQTKLYSLRTGI